MSFIVDDCVLVLVGIVQVLQQVCCIVDIGYFDVVVVCIVVDSVFCVDVFLLQVVFGDCYVLKVGLCLLYNYFCNQGQDLILLKLVLLVLQLECCFVQDGVIVNKVVLGIECVQCQVIELGDSGYLDVLVSLGSLYVDIISYFKSWVMVQGNLYYLGQVGVVVEICVLLLVVVCLVVLWCQLGGSYWDFLFG